MTETETDIGIGDGRQDKKPFGEFRVDDGVEAGIGDLIRRCRITIKSEARVIFAPSFVRKEGAE